MAYCERIDLNWKNKDLYFGKEFQLSLIPDDLYPKMWRIKFKDGCISDKYNFTRAKENAIVDTVEYLNKTIGQAAQG